MLTVKDLVKTFPGSKGEKGRVRAVDGVTFEVEPGHLYTLLGPSGCGKTTTLRCVAGLEDPDTGVIKVGDTTMFSSNERTKVPANKRGLGMVFQSYAIWPHMNVFKNVSFPLEVADRKGRLGKSEIEQRVGRVLEVVQLDHLASRQATDLSGGQQQRLALARALVMEPPLLLLDEPLSNLDAQLREEMRFELKRLQREMGITAIYVTHDQVEALAMSNRIAVMNGGNIEQIGKPRDIYERPSSKFVAGFIGTTNFLEGRVGRREPGNVYVVSTPTGEIRTRSEADLPVGTDVILSIRPEHIGLAPADTGVPGPNTWRGRVETRAFLGESVDHLVHVGERRLQVRCPTTVSIAPGNDVLLEFPADLTSIIPADR
ncbi:MAG: ABC transporter ATP-binding protein [Actinobacteria bacterium]|nr:ABC transporter ATP-binding protein [Actinomycetota bacterium]